VPAAKFADGAARAKSSLVPEKGELKMKKMFNKTVKGYYVMSIILGALLALSIATMLEVAVLDLPVSLAEELGLKSMMGYSDFWSDLWCLLPLGICDAFYLTIGSHWQNVMMVTTTILAVFIYVQMYGTKDSRTKTNQAWSFAVLLLLVATAYRYAFHSARLLNGALALVPVVGMIIPFMNLKRIRVTKKSEGDEAQGEAEATRMPWKARAWQRTCQFLTNNPGPAIITFALLAFCFVGAVQANSVAGEIGCAFAAVAFICLMVRVYSNAPKK